jgi:SpoVK/Ycf46/Vps4 family AAA+-type ATPase
VFGPPGVGKTFTAEAVAERSRVPLYSMSAGDLGIKPSDVEKALERALELCRMWNAMLLLDEADVFLGARTSESLARNELVSIFLTKLEYYQGILFLTTNRISSIDHAFQSRVDLFLPYHDLTSEARRQVWENFIDRAGRDKFDITEESLEKLSHLKLNGREIKNLIKSAQLLSLKSGGKVPMDRLYMLADKRVQALLVLDDADA